MEMYIKLKLLEWCSWNHVLRTLQTFPFRISSKSPKDVNVSTLTNFLDLFAKMDWFKIKPLSFFYIGLVKILLFANLMNIMSSFLSSILYTLRKHSFERRLCIFTFYRLCKISFLRSLYSQHSVKSWLSAELGGLGTT